MTEQCCNALKVTLHNKPLQLWRQYAGLYILSEEKINGRKFFVKIDDGIGVALWYMLPPHNSWGFGDLTAKGSNRTIMRSHSQTGPNCPHEVLDKQWMYFERKMNIFIQWLFGGNNIKVEPSLNNDEAIHEKTGEYVIFPLFGYLK